MNLKKEINNFLVFSIKHNYLFVMLFFIISNDLISQKYTHSEEVIISNSIIYEQNRIEALAINNLSSSTVTTRSSIEQSSSNDSNTRRITEISSNCNFIKSKPSEFEFLLKEDNKLFIRVTLYGKCAEVKSLFNAEIKLINQNKEVYPKSGDAYLLKTGNILASRVQADKDLYLSIFFEDRNEKKVYLFAPYSPSLQKYNEIIKANEEQFLNIIAGERWKLDKSSPLSKVYYVFSENKFTFDVKNISDPEFSSDEFFEIVFKWKKSENFLVKEIPVIIDK